MIDGDLKPAIEQYKKVADRYRRSDPATAAQALLRMADAYRKLGDSQWRSTLEQVVRDFPDQKEAAALARSRLGAAAPEAALRGDRAVWTGPKADMFGRVSPDGRFISFTDWSGFQNLSLHDLRSNADRPLTGNKGWEDPNWGGAECLGLGGRSVLSPIFGPRPGRLKSASCPLRRKCPTHAAEIQRSRNRLVTGWQTPGHRKLRGTDHHGQRG